MVAAFVIVAVAHAWIELWLVYALLKLRFEHDELAEAVEALRRDAWPGDE